MNSFKKIFVSIKGQIDQVADEFENHEALAGAAINDLQEIAGKTRLHLHRIQKMSAHYQKQLHGQQEQADLWSDRAIKARQDDEQKALQCVKRLRQTQQQISVLEQQYLASKSQEDKISNDLNKIQDQLQILKSKKEILAARQNRAGIKELLQDSHGNPLQEVNNIFDRWEGKVVCSEFDQPDDLDIDPFANSFEREEDEFALKKMLDELTEKPQNSDDNSTGEDHVR